MKSGVVIPTMDPIEVLGEKFGATQETPGNPIQAQEKGASDGEPDIVMMSAKDYFYSEDEGFAKICVVRIGDNSQPISVSYETMKDKSVMAGGSSDYKSVSGIVTFKPGDSLEYIEVPIVADQTWETMEKFQIRLIQVEHGHAVFGKLTTSTIYLVDDDIYPGRPPKGQDVHSGFSEIWLFIKERWAARHPKPIKSLCCLFYATFHGLLGTFILRYFLDDILVDNTESIAKQWSSFEDFATPAILAGVYVFSALLVWKLDYKFVDIRGNSGTRKDLRNWLMRKYVWYDEEQHISNMKDTAVANGLISNVEELVQCVWYTHYLLIAAIFDLVCNATYAIYLTWHAVLPICVLGPFIVVVLTCRSQKLMKLVQIRQDAEDSWIEIMDEAMDNWRLINSHGLQDHVAGTFKKDYDGFYKKHRKSRFYQTNTEWIPRFFNEMVLGFIMIAGAYLNSAGLLSIGTFAALISIFRVISSKMIVISKSVIKMQRGTIALDKISRILNSSTGVDQKLKASHHTTKQAIKQLDADSKRRLSQIDVLECLSGNKVTMTEGDKFTKTQNMMGKFSAKLKEKGRKRSNLTAENKTDIFSKWREKTADMSRIRLRNVHFNYKTGHGHDGNVTLLQRMNLNIPLNSAILIVGCGPASGILTLMKILARVLFPTEGTVDIPGHLKTILLDEEPLLFDSTLYENLIFGNKNVKEADVWEIAEGLGMSRKILDNPDKKNLPVGNKGCNLRLVERQVVSIARAVIADPNVILFNKADNCFSDEHRNKVMSFLVKWRNRNNVPLPAKQELVSGRTLIVSRLSDRVTPAFIEMVDVVLTLSDKGESTLTDARSYILNREKEKKSV